MTWERGPKGLWEREEDWEDTESAKRRIEFQQAQSWSWRGRPAKASAGLAKRLFPRAHWG